MKVWNSRSLSKALKIDIENPNLEAGIVHFNSRDVKEGDLFIALQGENGNGHDYALDAYNRGAGILVLEKMIEGIPKEKIVIVDNTNDALSHMAKYKRASTNATIIAITGSAGKTSTRDWLRATLDNFGRCYSSRGSFNNILGVRLELASLPNDTEYGIFEVGMNHGGEIRKLIHFVNPHIAMINNVLPSHIGNFDSIDQIADAKSEIFESMADNGIAILNRSNKFFEHCKDKAKAQNIEHIYSFGENEEDADANLVKYDGEYGHIVRIDGKEISFKTPLGGSYRILNLTAILLICMQINLDLEKVASSFASLSEPKGRGQISEIEYNNHNIKIIDDSYNAAFDAMVNSLKHLKELSSPYKVAVIGEMRELGGDEVKYHLELLKYVDSADKVHTVGPLMKHLYDKLPTDIKGSHFDDYEALQNNLKDVLDRDMMVLFKAANGVMLWKIVQKLLNQ